MPAGIASSDSMFSVRETPWHGLGALLEHPSATIAEAIEASGLGWRVEREPIAVDRGDAATAQDWWEPRCEEIPGFYATVRQDTRAVLGIAGERYRIVQNEEAFQFVDQRLGTSLHFETAGSLHGGRRVWVLATLPEHVEVGGDAVRPYVLLMNSHDGVDRRDRSDDAGQGHLHEYAQLGSAAGAAEILDSSHRADQPARRVAHHRRPAAATPEALRDRPQPRGPTRRAARARCAAPGADPC
jgi:hypothetical protein